MTDNYNIQSIWVKSYRLIFERLDDAAVQNITANNLLNMIS
jgi:hypothetical protein